MSLNSAHEGYIYQDLLTVYFIFQEILEERNSSFQIDEKNVEDDRFDDLTITNEEGIFRKQIKYSNEKSKHQLEKRDLSSDGNYHLALHQLFYSWQSFSERKNSKVRLCLAWDAPHQRNELYKLMVIAHSAEKTFNNTECYRIDIDKLWPENGSPISSWRVFKKESQQIDRADFEEFCQSLIIELDFPKSSLDIDNAGDLEQFVIEQTKKIGIGIYPNNHLNSKEVVLKMLHLVQKCRAEGKRLSTNEVMNRLKIKTDYGSIEQVFPVENSFLVSTPQSIKLVNEVFQNHQKVIVTGEPGAGKSWFISNLEKTIPDNIHIIRHYCYTDLKDTLQLKRIKLDVLYGNLVGEIINQFPELKNVKQEKYASNLAELNLLLKNIPEKTLLIIDGLDHIRRIFELKGRGVAECEIEIIETIDKLQFGDNIECLILSQPISELDNISDFIIRKLPRWEIGEVKQLMQRYTLADKKLGEIFLSDLLLEKSKGNPLYLKYLIKEVKQINTNILADYQKLPIYDFNLESYYKYLLIKIEENNTIPNILAGADFSLSKIDFQEITGLGRRVENTINSLLPILRQNYTQGGYIIYHESFRRFMIEKLKQDEVSVYKVVFKPLIDWLEEKGFYQFPKV